MRANLKNILVVDIDGTLTNGEYPYHLCTPNQKVIDKVNKCYDEGWEIKLLTARGQNTYQGDSQRCDDVYRIPTEDWLNQHGVKYHSLSFQKPAAIYYIDDKALRPDEFVEMCL
jgi:capsule biosynthesis phosphatase